MKIVSGITLTLLLLSMLTLAFNIQPIKATGTIYIRADGSVDPPTAPIGSPDNVTYTFTDNIYDSIVVERNNILVDGAGYSVEGPALESGISLAERSNVTIKNMEIKAFDIGIHLSYSSNNSISGNNIANNFVGISLWGSSNNSISRNKITGNYWYAIELVLSSNNSFYHNNFVENSIQVETLDSMNLWDDNYPSGGNYWSDYTDVDLYSGPYQSEAGGDGIWDHPYIIDANNQDRYPLVEPYTHITDVGSFHLFDSPTNRSLFKVAWKPDGSYALLVARGPQGYGSEIFKFDGNSHTLLLNDSSIIVQDAAWNPDGSYALFTAHYYANQNHRFKILKYNGTDFSTIQEGGTDDMRAIAWKPDGSYALIVGGNWAAGIVWKFDGNNLTKVSYPSFWKFMLVDWRPDGSYALIVDFFGDICKFDGTTLTLLTEAPTTTNDIGWSADGSYALLTGWFNLEWEEHLVVLKFDGISFRDVTWRTGTTHNLAGISSSITGETLIVGGGGTVLAYDGNMFTKLTEGMYGGLVDVDWKPDSSCALIVGGKTILLYIPASIIVPDVVPNTLNLKNEGQRVTCYIELPESYNVSDIDVSSILLNDTIPVDDGVPTEIGDYDSDGIPDLMVQFNRTELTAHIYHVSGIIYGNVTLTITGQLTDGAMFEGSDTIEVMFGGDADFSGYVEMADFFIWRENFGKHSGEWPSEVNPDFDSNGFVELADFYIWRENFGATVPPPP